jgi:hypothetical protein
MVLLPPKREDLFDCENIEAGVISEPAVTNADVFRKLRRVVILIDHNLYIIQFSIWVLPAPSHTFWRKKYAKT